jgi:hypothetical protein
VLFNSVDVLFTIVALKGGATEVNIVMEQVLALGVPQFLFVKLVVVNLMILFVGSIGRRYVVGRMGLSIVVVVYALLTCYHLVNLGLPCMTGS